MEYQKLINILGDVSDKVMPRFITEKWIEIYDESGGTFNVNKEVRFKTPQLISDLCDWNCAYLVVKVKISTTDPDDNAYDRKLALKNNAPFFSFILKINGNLVENAEDLGIVMPLYCLLCYSNNYRKTTGSLCNYYRDEPNSGHNNNNRNRIHYSIKDSESFDYKTGITGKLPDNEDDLENIEIVMPLEHLSRFMRQWDILLIYCGISLKLNWSKNCVLTNTATRNHIAADTANNLPEVLAINAPTNIEFSITDCKLYVPVVTLSAENENKLYEQLKTEFSLTVYWNKYRCQITNQTII